MLNCPYIKWLESCSTVYDYNKQYGKLIDIIKETNTYVGKYHDTQHLIKVGYLAFLTVTAFTRNNTTGMVSPYYDCLRPELDLIVKAALLHDYCYFGERDDILNIKHTQNMVRVLAVEHSDIITREDAEKINELIEYTYYDFDNPKGIPPKEPGQEIYFDILRDCDQLYSAVYFDKEMLFKLYEDIGKRFNYNIDAFILRNKEYSIRVGEALKTDFAQKVYKEIAEELSEKHDELYYSFPNCDLA